MELPLKGFKLLKLFNFWKWVSWLRRNWSLKTIGVCSLSWGEATPKIWANLELIWRWLQLVGVLSVLCVLEDIQVFLKKKNIKRYFWSFIFKSIWSKVFIGPLVEKKKKFGIQKKNWISKKNYNHFPRQPPRQQWRQ